MPNPQFVGIYVDGNEPPRTWQSNAEAFNSLAHMEDVLARRRQGRRPRNPPTLIRWEKAPTQRPIEIQDTDLWFFPKPQSEPFIEYVPWGVALYRIQSRTTIWFRMTFQPGRARAVIIPFHPATRKP